MEEGDSSSETGSTACLTTRQNKASRRTQYFVTFSATTGAVAARAVVGYTSPAVPHLLHPTAPADGSLKLSADQANWFGSSINLSAALGAVLGGLAMNKLGRKLAILLTCCVCIASWVLVGAAQNVAMLMVGRVISGICLGATCVIVPTYIGEIASTDIRGFLASCFQCMATVGNVWGYTFGAFIPSWRWLTAAMAIPAAMCVILMPFAKESPMYLLSKGKYDQAKDSLQYFRGPNYDCDQELEATKQFLEETTRNRASFKDLLKPYNLKPFMICFFILVFTQTSGITPVIFNLYTIFEDAGTGISENMSSIIVGLMQVFAAIVAAFLMDRAGRKTLLIVSAVGATFSQVALGDYFYYKDEDSEWAKKTLGWLPLTSLVVYIFTTCVGFITVQWVMLAELFSPEVKAVASSAATMPMWVLAFVIGWTFIPMQTAIGDYGVFWFYGGMCALALIFTVLFVPETKGKTMQEISRYFGGPAGRDEEADPSTAPVELST